MTSYILLDSVDSICSLFSRCHFRLKFGTT